MAFKKIQYPIWCWGMPHASINELYDNAPFQSPIKPRSFERRLIARLDVTGALTQASIARAYADRERAYEGGGAVYEINQLSTGMRYVGITSHPEHRKRSHFGCPPSCNSLLAREMRRCGRRDFRFRIIVKGDIKRADLRRIERALIESEDTFWPNGFNARRGDLQIDAVSSGSPIGAQEADMH